MLAKSVASICCYVSFLDFIIIIIVIICDRGSAMTNNRYDAHSKRLDALLSFKHHYYNGYAAPIYHAVHAVYGRVYACESANKKLVNNVAT